MKSFNSDIIIVGGGLIGLTAAYFLANQGFSLTIIEKKTISNKPDLSEDIRTTAIAEGTKKIFEKFGFWKNINNFVEPIKYINVYDRNPINKIIFKNENPKGFLGYIVENKTIKKTLINKLIKFKNIKLVEQTNINEVEINNHNVVVKTSRKNYHSSILVAADGKNSFISNYLNMKFFSKNYYQRAIVVNFLHSKNHKNTAYEMFYEFGPLATLPMNKKSKNHFSSSLIWSHNSEYIQNLEKINDKLFLKVIDEKTNNILGNAIKILSKKTFPLSAHINCSFVSKRVFYIGDSAHSIHPIAGQGWNVGMRDVDVLVNLLIEARSLGFDLGSEFISKKYQNMRYFDAYSLYQLTDKLNNIFMFKNSGANYLRQFGFNFLNNNNFIKSKISNFAMGLDRL